MLLVFHNFLLYFIYLNVRGCETWRCEALFFFIHRLRIPYGTYGFKIRKNLRILYIFKIR